jgi:biopolymer transport protein ExbD
MNRILVVCLWVVTLGNTFTPLGAIPAAAADNASFAGTWKGTMNRLPGIDLTIREHDQKISGEVVFYFQRRTDVHSRWHASPDPALPLLNPHLNGRTLIFEVERHVCDGCAEFGPNATFRMELFGANEAKLIRLEADGTKVGPQVKLVRSSQSSAQAASPLQAGVSVEMPVTTNAVPMPEADQPDALIVTVTVEGKVYLGIQPVDFKDLAAKLRQTSAGKPLYIKADARAPYAMVISVLDAATAFGSDRTILLTSQRGPASPGTIVSPEGFIVMNTRPGLSL